MKTVGLLILIYLLYSTWFLFTWGILPYTFGYTVYMVEEDYPEYDINEGDFLLIKYVDTEVEDGLVILREGLDYNLYDGAWRPYGLVVSRNIYDDICLFIDKLNNIF